MAGRLLRHGIGGCALLLLMPGCDSSSKTSPELWRDFSGEKAFAHVRELVELGPRPPASEAIETARVYLETTLREAGWNVTRQSFVAETPRGPVTFVNLIARHGPAAEEPANDRFLLCSHYDTKVFDDIVFVGANDSGSSTGTLLELARVLAGRPDLARRVDLVFFDGEEAQVEFSEADGLYGSRHFAAELASRNAAARYRGAILLDMMGDRSLRITLSPDSPPALAAGIFAAAEALGVRDHFTYFSSPILDDHVPLNRVGIPAINLIDFEYAAWHTADDTLDQISPESLALVARVTLYFLEHSAFK